ncbi:MAG: hypothetical protein GY697_00095 [Desulfobacterales bacterium]|nr:hypothetical protein [Desulfobacterales bacterium]
MISRIPQRSFRNFAIYTGVLAIVIGAMVVPSYFAIGKAEANLAKIETQVREQRLLVPVFGKLMKKRRALNTSSAKMPVRAALARDDASGVADALTRLAADNRLQMTDVSLDLNALVNEANLIKVDMVMRGNLADYRAFLHQLIVMSHLEFIERVRMMAIPGEQEYSMRAWIALK